MLFFHPNCFQHYPPKTIANFAESTTKSNLNCWLNSGKFRNCIRYKLIYARGARSSPATSQFYVINVRRTYGRGWTCYGTRRFWRYPNTLATIYVLWLTEIRSLSCLPGGFWCHALPCLPSHNLWRRSICRTLRFLFAVLKWQLVCLCIYSSSYL